MRLLRVEHEVYEPGDAFRVYGLGDLHVGDPTFDEAALKKMVARIKADPFARWVGVGDYADLIDSRDRRFGYLPIDQRYHDAMLAPGGIPAESAAHVIELLEPIASRCWGLLEGNHETAVYSRTNYSLLTAIAEGLRLQHRILGYEGWISVPFARRSQGVRTTSVLHIQAAHGAAAPRRPGSLYNNAQVLKSLYPAAHIIMRGHGHQRVAQVYDAVAPGVKHLRADPWVFMMTGVWKTGRYRDLPGQPPKSTYEARKDFAPTGQLGPPVVIVRPATRNGQDPSAAPFQLSVEL